MLKGEKGTAPAARSASERKAYLKQLKELVNASPVYRFLGMKVVHAAGGSSRVELKIQEDLKNVWGTVHGGILAALLDSACGVALGTLLDPGEVLVTLDLRINYFTPFHNGTLIGEGMVLHKGRHTGVAEGTLRNAEGRLIAKGMSTHFCKRAPEAEGSEGS